MKHTINAIYENGMFRPIGITTVPFIDGQAIRITLDDEVDPEALRLAMNVYEGLSVTEMNEIEQIALDRGNLFGGRSSK